VPGFPPAAFSAALRVCDTTSDVPLRPRRIRHSDSARALVWWQAALAHPPGSRGACAPSGPPNLHRLGSLARSGRRLVKDGVPLRARTPSIAECSLPRARIARMRVGSRGARHRCRCLRAGGFRHRDPASGALSPAGLARLHGEIGRLDRDLAVQVERRSSTSATNPIREHHHRSSDPHPRFEGWASRARALCSATSKARPKPRSTQSLHRARVVPPPPRTRPKSRSWTGASDQPRVHEPGPAEAPRGGHARRLHALVRAA
jgi:hypothetical protein